jgi:hypothetical protein
MPSGVVADNTVHRLGRTSTNSEFTPPAFLHEVSGVAEPGADVAFHLIIPIKAGGQTQVVSIFTGSDPKRYQDTLASAFWNGTNWGNFEGSTPVAAQKAIPAGDTNKLHILGFKGKIYYSLNQTFVGGGTLSIPNAPLVLQVFWQAPQSAQPHKF